MKKAKVTNKELWLFNATTSDVSISDLGVKVPAGESINVYSTNPHLTEEQVDKSRRYGALLKRLEGAQPVLKVVNKKVSNGKAVVRKIHQSKEPIRAVKNRSTIVIEPTTEEITDDKGFDFADYGVDTTIASPVKESIGVVIKTKEDQVVEPVSVQVDDPSKPSNPMGKMMETVAPTNSFVVVKETVPEVKVVTKSKTKEPIKVGRVESVQSEAKIEMAEIKSEELVAVKKDCGVVIESKSDIEFLDSLPINPKEGMRVASRTKNGITVMKIKE